MAKVILIREDAVIPKRATEYSIGYDLCSAENTIIPFRGRKIICTGIQIQVPAGTYGRIAPRSGLACKNGIDIGGGIIDPDYQGEIKVIMFNHDEKDFKVSIGDRIAQLIFEKAETPEITEVKEFASTTARGSGGFGSTGIKSESSSKVCAASGTEEKKN
jgi:dUTP pyrophosphatase